MQEQNLKKPNRVEAVCVGSDEDRGEDVGNIRAQRIAEEQAGLALTDEGLEHALGEIVADRRVLDHAKRDELVEVVLEVTVGLAERAIGFDQKGVEVAFRALGHGFHQRQGMFVMIGEAQRRREHVYLGVSVVAEDLRVRTFKKCGGVGEGGLEFAELAHDVAVAVGHHDAIGGLPWQVGRNCSAVTV